MLGFAPLSAQPLSAPGAIIASINCSEQADVSIITVMLGDVVTVGYSESDKTSAIVIPGPKPFGFSVSKFRARYPEFAAVSDDTLFAYYDETALYFRQDDASFEQDKTKRLMLLNMLVAHIASISGASSSGILGRVTSATEGSVSVTAAASMLPGSAEWFTTSRYGLAFWQATRSMRGFRYIVKPQVQGYPRWR